MKYIGSFYIDYIWKYFDIIGQVNDININLISILTILKNRIARKLYVSFMLSYSVALY